MGWIIACGNFCHPIEYFNYCNEYKSLELGEVGTIIAPPKLVVIDSDFIFGKKFEKSL